MDALVLSVLKNIAASLRLHFVFTGTTLFFLPEAETHTPHLLHLVLTYYLETRQ